jgi:hypothetical protein
MFVLRQIAPPGKSALASEATALALTIAATQNAVVEGDYLEWSDPDAKDGFGDDRWTPDLAKAKKFATFTDAMECWKAQSRIRPIRDDGKPNRPLTAYSVMPQRIEG